MSVEITHRTVRANGAAFHVASAGEGPVLLLLHGWPEFWLTWEPVMRLLADRFTLVAPDLRGFGDSDKPDRLWGNKDHAADMLALMEAMGIERFGAVGHDVGGGVMQPMARQAPEKLSGLFFFDFAYPGIGPRFAAPDRLKEIWYQSFHLLEMAPELVGATRDSCRAYIGHFLRHWAHDKHAFDDVLEQWVDNFLKPGNLRGGFNYYQANNADRILMLKGEASPLPPIRVPTCVRWAEHDAIFPLSFADRLGDTFTELDFAPMEGVGHYPHREAPERAAEAIGGFFSRIFGER